MSINLITGTRGVAHITPSQDAHWHRGIVGTETCVFETGSAFESEVMTNNRVKIKDGVGMIQGRMFNIDPNSYDEVTIANGSQGYNRIDLIVAELTVNPGAGTQSIAWNVVRGTLAEGTPTPPTYTSGDLDNGDLTAGIPIAQVTLTGINITACESVATMSKSISTLNTRLSQSLFKVVRVITERYNFSGNSDLYATHYFTSSEIPEGYIPVGILGIDTGNNGSHQNYLYTWSYAIVKASSGRYYASIASRSIDGGSGYVTYYLNVLCQKAV